MQESGNKPQPPKHALSIRSMPDGFSFSLSAAKGYILKELKIPTAFDFTERFEEYVQTRGWAEKENYEITLIDFAEHFLLLPDTISDEEQIKAFFDFQFDHEESNQIFTAPLCDGKQLFCWEIPTNRDMYFSRLFPQLTQYSSAYLLANWAIRQAFTTHRPALIAHLYGKTLQLFAADTQKLLFANTFTIKDSQEITYFVLRCLDQLSLDPLHTRCTFCSESAPEETILELLSPYIRHIEMAAFSHQTDEPLLFTEKKHSHHAHR
jgi:hypothetical protein